MEWLSDLPFRSLLLIDQIPPTETIWLLRIKEHTKFNYFLTDFKDVNYINHPKFLLRCEAVDLRWNRAISISYYGANIHEYNLMSDLVSIRQLSITEVESVLRIEFDLPPPWFVNWLKRQKLAKIG